MQCYFGEGNYAIYIQKDELPHLKEGPFEGELKRHHGSSLDKKVFLMFNPSQEISSLEYSPQGSEFDACKEVSIKLSKRDYKKLSSGVVVFRSDKTPVYLSLVDNILNYSFGL